jgi:GAF domain-containing protein/HAMP domain-containing protein
LMLPSCALFRAGTTQILALGTLALGIALASLVLPRRPMAWAALASLVAAGLTFLIDRAAAWPRFDFAQLGLLRVFILGTIGIAGLSILWQLVRTYQNTQTIRSRLLIAFVLVVLLPAVVVGAGAGVVSLQRERQQAFERLETAASLREVQINDWLEDCQAELLNALNTEDTQGLVHLLLEDAGTSSLRQEAHQKLQEHFQRLIRQGGHFNELFLIDAQGRAILSSDPAQEGKIHSGQAYFSEGLKGAYIQPPHYASSPGRIFIIFARPVIDKLGHVLVLVGRARPSRLNEIMSERAGLGETGKAYLVAANYALLTVSRGGEEAIYVRTYGARAALEDRADGFGEYLDYSGRQVMGIYGWLPELQAALLVEQDEAEVLRGTYTALSLTGGIALAAVGSAIVVSLFIARSIANPLANLAGIATRIAGGNLGLSATVEREDEIGALARAFNSMTQQLSRLISSLEQRVAERTRDLERRAAQLRAAADVGRAAASIRNLDELLPQVTRLINEHFGYYHAGIFLLDEKGEYAVLQAANSEGGQRMLARGHRLRVGEVGIVGHVTGQGESRIALDVGADAVYFDNPDLPDTRSEMALPLQVSGRVLGALDVQSTEAAAFTQEDIAVLQVLADQVSVAIENARLFAKAQEALEAMRRVYGEVSRQAWEKTLRARPELAFRSDECGVTRAGDIWRPEMEQAVQEGRTVQIPNPKSQASNPLAVPIKVRGQVGGVLDTYKPGEAGLWTAEEIATLEQITEQLGAALESARLYQDVQRTAARERLTRQITDELRHATTTEGIVQTAVDALFKALGTSHGFGRLNHGQ